MGYALAGLGAVLFSAKAIVVKLTYRYGVDALTIIGFRMMLSLPFYAAIAWYQARQARQGLLPVLTRRERLQIVFLGFIGYYLSSFLDFLGLQYISAGLERLILFLSPTFVLLLSAILLKRAILPSQWLALGLSYLGVVFVFLQDLSFSGGGVMIGSAFVLGSAFSYACYLIGSGELIKRVGATRLAAYAMSVSALIAMAHFLVVHGLQGLAQPLPVYELSLLHAVVNTVLPTFMIMWAVARIGAPLTAQLGLLGPVSVLFLAAWMLGEPITSLQLLGTAFTLVGAVALGRLRNKPRG
ncbi:EamA family transporter [Pusillimonas sp. TS35]|uniref:DMT family transporter n=1 Tax=Paracandidimonas lactea TaxID=2895524 RepID=UPI0013721123|nr:DMT family transporter [Paracandidimonas lactea]MYN11598.1 EamA family transporter [Pusillimonas sp. TS35]